MSGQHRVACAGISLVRAEITLSHAKWPILSIFSVVGVCVRNFDRKLYLDPTVTTDSYNEANFLRTGKRDKMLQAFLPLKCMENEMDLNGKK